MTTRLALLVMVLAAPSAAQAQPIELFGSVGPTITDTGNSLAAGVGFSPHPRFTVAFTFDRTHLSTRTTRDRDVISSFRGGTLFLGTGEVRFMPLGRDRFGPFALAGVAAGISRPNVNEVFPTPVTNHVRVMFFGGGIQVPLGDRMTVFADTRMMVGAEGIEGIIAVAPVRAGVAWRF